MSSTHNNTDSDLDFEFDDDDASGDFNTELTEQFKSATIYVQEHFSQFSQKALLEFYGLYKQATVGECDTIKPSVLQMQARAKWSAWHALGDISCNEAKQKYIEKLEEFDKNWQPSLSKKSYSGWVVHSIEQAPEDPEALKAEHEKTVWDYVKEDNLKRLSELLKESDLHELDSNGMALIHWATDRNAIDILQYLLKYGANVNQRDIEQQTPLHYAASCDYVDVLRLLISYNADITLRDAEGQTCYDVTNNDEIRTILKR